MANGQTSCVLVLALAVAVSLVFENFPLRAEGRKLVDLRQEKNIVDNNDVHEELDDLSTHMRAGRQKREARNCGGCTRQWAAQRACFSYSSKQVRIAVLCRDPIRRRHECWKTKTVRHLVQKCCSGYHAEGIYCHIDCGGCHENRDFWQYACRKKETFYRTQKYICDFGETPTRYCIRRVPYTVFTDGTFCCDGYVKDRGFCRRDTP